MNDRPLLCVSDLHRYFGRLHAVRSLDFELDVHQVLGLLGPNGAGKSSAMRMLSGSLAPTAGRIWISGIDLLEHPIAAKSRLGYLPEHPPLYQDCTVDEYLRFCARLHRVPPRGERAAVEQAKARCGLATVGGRLIAHLSRGFQQRVGIAQALVHQPRLLILDEPSAGLDPIQAREIRALVRELREDCAVIFSSHLIGEIQAICDRVQILHHGALVLDSALEAIGQEHGLVSTRVGFAVPPDPARLQSLDEVERVERIDPERFRLFHRPEVDIASGLADLAVHEGWKPFELLRERRTLEEVFIALTCTEESADLAAA